MTPFNKISDAEKEMMADWITCYATEGMKQPKTSMENLLSYWNDAKTSGDLYTLFGDKLILTKEVNYKRHSEDYWREIRDELFNTAFYRNLRSYVRDKMWEENKIPNANNWSTLWYALDNIGYWVDNHYGPKHDDTLTKEEKKEWYEINLPIPGKEKPMVIRYGDKMMRFVGKLAAELKIEGFEEFRIKQSQIVNDRYTKGELCLSIHPMDYMTMSDNDCNWESCMNWRYHGDYRQGTVEMMNSPCVVVAYVKSHRDMENGWNNKKWRQLFIVRPDVIVPIKGYPYRNETLEDACMDWLRELAQKNLNWTYEDEKIRLKNDGEVVNYKDKKYVFDFYTNCMYNDIYDIHPSWFNPKAESFTERGSYESLTFTYSGVSECMICGDIHDFDYDNNANELACYECSDTRYCAYCHGRIYSDDNCYEIDGEIVCDDCYWDVDSCQVCGERHSDYNLKLIYIYKNWDKYESGIDRWCENDAITICKDCFEDMWNSLSKYPSFNHHGYTSYKVEDTDDEFFKLFGYESKKDFLMYAGWDSDEEETE